MTGFGESAGESGDLRIEARLHGVNHRFLDIVVRVPDDLRFAEAGIRERVALRARRGRCEVTVTIRRFSAAAGLEIDTHAIAALHRAAQPLVEAGLLVPQLSLGDLLRQPALARLEAPRLDWDESREMLLWRTLDAALDRFDRVRADEGERIRVILRRLVDDLTASAAALRALAPAATARLGEQLRRRLAELLGEVGESEERWLHEAALLAEKADVREEIDRLDAHLGELRRVLETGEDGGRRVDFLAQELLRELNTLAAKCRDVTVVQTALQARLTCEQIREQAQNVE